MAALAAGQGILSVKRFTVEPNPRRLLRGMSVIDKSGPPHETFLQQTTPAANNLHII